ncbi:type 1 glutamine amidotransferase domain-containing protein [Flagellimonas hymeniacidonis]|uniref:Type 1 glutamine amidotransferase domain-containing protein n=1 Tax=Flagellimonas hymeniacidonis TaxID=2603628 RepID=A0A5C8V439_9FLAO|nr:type 1 glutamine amidotransferase domain-containing protein [Flagellimonas hymeniacidonis]TXN36121.1 type 1 glutamine amidotransferase domain-containing protein [Flagellimonas hymeniacidonis]
MKRVLFITTSHNDLGESGLKTGVWLEEVATPYYRLREESIHVEIASVHGGNIPIDPVSESRDWMTEDTIRFKGDKTAMILMNTSLRLDEINPSEYDLVYFPGGHGPMWDFVNNPLLNNTLQHSIQEEKVIAAMCHGVSVLVDAFDADGNVFVKGRKITSFADSEEISVGAEKLVPFLLESKLTALGGIYSKGNDFSSYTVVDRNLITGQNPASSSSVSIKMIDLLTD